MENPSTKPAAKTQALESQHPLIQEGGAGFLLHYTHLFEQDAGLDSLIAHVGHKNG